MGAVLLTCAARILDWVADLRYCRQTGRAGDWLTMLTPPEYGPRQRLRQQAAELGGEAGLAGLRRHAAQFGQADRARDHLPRTGSMITDGPLPGSAGSALHGPRSPVWLTATFQRRLPYPATARNSKFPRPTVRSSVRIIGRGSS